MCNNNFNSIGSANKILLCTNIYLNIVVRSVFNESCSVVVSNVGRRLCACCCQASAPLLLLLPRCTTILCATPISLPLVTNNCTSVKLLYHYSLNKITIACYNVCEVTYSQGSNFPVICVYDLEL